METSKLKAVTTFPFFLFKVFIAMNLETIFASHRMMKDSIQLHFISTLMVMIFYFYFAIFELIANGKRLSANLLHMCRYCSGRKSVSLHFVASYCTGDSFGDSGYFCTVLPFKLTVNMANAKLFLILKFCLYFVRVIVASAPKLMQFNTIIDLGVNDTFVLACNLRTGSNIIFEWTHNGVNLSNSTSVKLDNSPRFSLLTFRNIQRQHAGKYKCRVSNLVGESDATTTQINVQGDVSIFNLCHCGALLLLFSGLHFLINLDFNAEVSFMCLFVDGWLSCDNG